MDSETLKLINSNLKKYFGSVNGVPMFRLVWSNDVYEKRAGDKARFYGPIYLKTETGVTLEPKYFWEHARDKWVLERYYSGCPDPELTADENGHYEPVYFYKHSPTWEIVEFLMKIKIFGAKVVAKETEKERFEKMVEFYADELSQDVSSLEIHRALGSGIIVPSNYQS